MFTNISLIVCALGRPPFELIPPYIFIALLRADNATLALQFYAMFLLARNFSSLKQKQFPDVLRWFTIISMVFFLCRAFYCFFTGDVSFASYFSLFYKVWITTIPIEGFIAVRIMYKNYKKEPLNLLRYHISTLAFYYMLPYCVLKILENPLLSPMNYLPTVSFRINLLATSLTSIWLTAVIFYCARKLMGIRFLNMEKHVQSKLNKNFDFVDDFKVTLSKIAASDTLDELQPITKEFIEKAFSIKAKHVSLILKRKSGPELKELLEDEALSSVKARIIERNFNRAFDENLRLMVFTMDQKIIIRDEVEFSQFYNISAEEPGRVEAIELMDKLEADIFVPIYHRGKFHGAIVINKGARPEEFFTDVERDELIIYADYVGTIITMNINQNLLPLIEENHALREEVYRSNKNEQLLRQCVESFVTNKKREIGLLTFRNRRFDYVNEVAKDLMGADLNVDKGLEMTQNIVSMATDVATFFSPKRALIGNKSGEELVVSVTPNTEKTTTVVTIAPATIADLIKDSMEHLFDQSKWNFLLALRATMQGAQVNNLIPSDTKFFLNLKVNFFEYATTKRFLLLELLLEDDALAFAQAAHSINNRKVFEEIEINYGTDEKELACRLFGVNPAIDLNAKAGLFETLDEDGTLYLKNVHILSINLQKMLLRYFTSGVYSPVESDEIKRSKVVIIFSTNHPNIYELVAQGKFLKEFYEELRKSSVQLPSLMTAAIHPELAALAAGIHAQVIKDKIYKNLLALNDVDYRKIAEASIVGIHDLRLKVRYIITMKAKRDVPNADVVNTANAIADLDLATAARLGKKAVLKDPHLLTQLINKFDGSQNKVAQFLGVNRSSVHRRCIQYNIKCKGADGNF